MAPQKEEMIDVFEMPAEPAVDTAESVGTVQNERGAAEHDTVHNPQHYQSKSGSFQVLDVIEEFELNYRLGNVCKYILRANNKHETPKEDLLKACFYLMREVKVQGYSKELKEFLEKQLRELNK